VRKAAAEEAQRKVEKKDTRPLEDGQCKETDGFRRNLGGGRKRAKKRQGTSQSWTKKVEKTLGGAKFGRRTSRRKSGLLSGGEKSAGLRMRGVDVTRLEGTGLLRTKTPLLNAEENPIRTQAL